MNDTQKLLAACVEYRLQLDKLERENAALRAERDELVHKCSKLREELFTALTR